MARLQPGDVFGPYRLERKLGVGGMAEVWLAQPLEPQRGPPRVVLKRVHPTIAENPKLLGLFFDEVRLAQRLKHPNVVAVFDSGRVGADHFMAMEHVDGLDLLSCLKAHGGPLWPAFAAALVADACAGLEYAHTLQSEDGSPLHIVHRDVSPDNLMVSTRGTVKLLDFGIARAADTENTTQTGSRKGKVRYMAPEYLRDHVANPRTDVYAMGATLFELCTGTRPFSQYRSLETIMRALLTREPLPRADKVRPSLPGELVSLIAAATAPEPEARLPSARALEQRLRAFLQEHAPPAPAEVGAEVRLWQQRLAEPLTAPKQPPAGGYGQLESTEFVHVHAALRDVPPDEWEAPADASASSVEVAHPLELTQFNLPVRLPAPPSKEALPGETTSPSQPVPQEEPSIILSPELESVAERIDTSKPRKR